MSEKNLKRKSADDSNSMKRRKNSSKELSAYFKSYKNGLSDIHLPLFRGACKIVQPARVLYPGSYRHITASLIFNDVVYVDSDKKIEACFKDELVLDWANENKEYDGEMKIKFVSKSFTSNLGEKTGSFGLAMSLSAGIVTTSCSKYLCKDGYFLVSDAHYDARMLTLDDSFTPVYVWNGVAKEFSQDLEGHFTTKDGVALTRDMVEESIQKPKARRSFKLQKEALFYLFKKVK